MKKLFIVFIIFLFSFSPVLADEKFTNSYYITYQITNSGLANITEDIIITNKTSDYYPSEQTFTYRSFNLGNVRAFDAQGEFEPEIKSAENTTTIHVKFRSQNAGIGKQTKLTLKYQTADIASLNGEVWQILIPGIKNLDFYDDFRLKLAIPPEFPEIQYVSVPSAANFEWTKDEIKDRGVVLIFGKNQYYKLSLDYFLKNDGLTPVLSSITIPPNTNYQDVFLERLNPKPAYSEKDADGNWIFWFDLERTSSLKINADMLINVYFDPKTSGSLNSTAKKQYTSREKYWDFQNFGNFSDKIKDLKTPRQIYDFAVNNLTYNYNRLNKAQERYTASEILKNPVNAICTDFTNVFISHARKNGIPAREVDGYAYTQNYEIQPLSLEKDILHAWPEYYNFEKQAWIMVDPTWGKTTNGIDYFDRLDLNHIAFVKKGISSETPYPPGSYKDESQNSKDVNVSFGKKTEWDEAFLKAEKKIDLSYDVPEWPISGMKVAGKISIQNKSQVEIFDLPFQLEINGQTVKDESIENLIPYQIHAANFALPEVKFWEKKDIILTTYINNKAVKKTVHFTPIYLWQNNIYYFGAGLTAILILFIIIGYTIRKKI